MTREQVLTAALALCCLFALGTSASTLDASVDTTPDDVITLDQASLPLPSDEVGSLKEQLQSDPKDRDPQSDAQSSSSGGSSDAESGGSSDDQPAQVSSGGGSGSTTEEPTLLDRLLALLTALLDLLVSLLPLFLVVGVVAAAVRHPRRIQALLEAALDRLGLDRGHAAGDAGTLLVPSPSNDVERAWYEMVQRLDLDDELAATSGEVAAAAVEAGVDPDVVEQVTEPFEQVRYGGAPLTEERRDRAREGLERFRAQVRDGGRR